jgi:hypothetical protein
VSYPQQGGYGAPPPGYPPPPGMYPQPPRKNNTGLIVGLVSVVVVALVAVVLVVVLTGGDDDKDTASGGLGDATVQVPGPNLPKGSGGAGSDGGSGSSGDSGSSDDSGGDSSGGGSGDGGPSPEAMADEVVRVVVQHDTETIRRYACTEQEADDLYSELARLDGVQVSAEVNDVNESGDTAQASITMSAGGQSEDFTVEMAKNDGGLWCVTGI